ncbi:TPA: hypothetical protein N0F65_009484 [Lagenidium giganteum]|uniref:Uncharacterized protein n=1 Tax=Lagenidium giganteum TaxID=4803 RepID=A0AAV2ZGZ7_9STRA|nr:TPA: hypothetical protein N0F65_009484 [Lagenidium giganteum]
MAELAGAEETQIRHLSRWIMSSTEGCYLTAFTQSDAGTHWLST